MRGYAEGTVDLTRDVRRNLDQCIVCRACETACPSGIRMGDMMEAFRYDQNKSRRKGPAKLLGRFLLQRVLPYRGRIAALSDLIWVYQATGLQRVVSAVNRRVFRKLGSIDRLQPRIPRPGLRRIPTDRKRPQGYAAEGKARVRVGLFLGCIASEWFAPVHRATIRVLRRNGCDVVLPDAQTCCGALHRHAGFLDEAEGLFARNVDAFRGAGIDAVIVNAAGCGAALKEPPPGHPDGLGPPVRDICEFLDEIGLREPRGRVHKKVAYDQPCHLLHGQQIGAGVVERLLEKIPGLELVNLRDSDRCCGSGGVYNLLQPSMAQTIQAEKCEAILESGADTVVTGNPGCAMQIRAGLANDDIEVLHPVELLDRSYRREG